MFWLKTQFDKLLLAFLILVLCGVALAKDGKIEAFALQAAGSALGGLLILVTGKGAPEDK